MIELSMFGEKEVDHFRALAQGHPARTDLVIKELANVASRRGIDFVMKEQNAVRIFELDKALQFAETYFRPPMPSAQEMVRSINKAFSQISEPLN